MDKNKRILSFLISFLMIFSFIVPINAENDEKNIFKEILKDDFEKNSSIQEIDSTEQKIYMVGVEGESVLELLDQGYDEEKANRIALDIQNKAIESIKSFKNVTIGEKYLYTTNGFSITTDRTTAKKISFLPLISSISEAQVYEKRVNNVRNILEIASIKEEYGIDGAGMVVAVLDSGVDHTHKDMNIDSDNVKLNEKIVNDLKSKNKITYGKYFSSKIPFAYNYADDSSNVVRDTLKERADFSHGTHVAGIIGANTKDGGVTGIAPNAQILNMKIFSNNPKVPGASEDKIVKAIDDAVKLGADVINMSFGIVAGLQDPSDVQQKAVANATNNGTIVVAAAGNDAYSTFPNKTKKSIDDGTISAPGIAEEAIQVGSLENSKMAVNSFIAKIGNEVKRIGYVGSDHDPEVLKEDYEIVDCGLGSKEEVQNLDLTGKIGLVKRGANIEFKDKKLNIQAKNALGVIIYNKDGDDELLPYISTDEKVNIPTLFISNTDGEYLKKNISNVTVNFKNERIIIDSTKKDTVSEFSSWGPTPNLGLKPDLIAVGGNVYSTMEGSKYGNMSGTSMAAPMISGVSALVFEKFKADGIKKNIPNYVKTALMNTANPKYQKGGKPYSVRLQGAGMVNPKAALSNKLFVRNNNKAKIELKEIEGPKTIELEFDNKYGNDLSLDIKVLGDTFTVDKKKIEAKNGVSKNQFTITPNVGKNEYVDGFIEFSTGDVKVTLPVLGFNGKWADLPMFDSADKENSIYNETRLDTAVINPVYTKLKPLGGDEIDPNHFAINPDDEGAYNNVIPKFSLLRVAKDFKITVENENGEVIKTLEDKHGVRKVVGYRDVVKAIVNFDWLWKGGIYDKNLGIQKKVEEGKYTINIYATPDFEGAKPQKLSYPLIVDKSAPVLKSQVYFIEKDTDNFVLETNAMDMGNPPSGINKFMFIINGTPYKENEELLFKLEEENGVYKKELPLKGNYPFYSLRVAATDYANNIGETRAYVIIKQNSKIEISSDKNRIKSGESLNLKYKLYNPDVDRYQVSIDNLDDVIYEGRETERELEIKSKDGKHKLVVKALNKKGLVIDVNYVEIEIEASKTESGLIVSNNTSDYTFRNGEIYNASYELKNTTTFEQSVSFIVALYDLNDNIVNTAVSEKKLKPGQKATMTNGIKIPDTGKYKLKIFVWDSVEDMNTIVPVNEIIQK